ncbi:MAG TPA: MFS transporter [Candidatus Dormibacteraeota bacterium]|nr:MFS transporter [Candidatus Dormibacteraeota bacterium]
MPADKQHKIRTLWVTGVLHAFTHMYQVALLPLYLQIQRDLRLSSVEQATLLVSVMGAAYFFPSYPMGVLADRWSRKKLLGSGLAINAVGFIALSFAPSYGWAVACVVLAGFGGSFYHPSATALIARLFPEGRGRALGWVGAGASVGFFVGPLYCGWRAVATGNWREPVLEVGIFGLVAAGIFAALAEEERPSADRTGRGDESSAGPQSFQVSTPNLPGKRGSSGLAVDSLPRPLQGAKKKSLFPTAALWLLFFGASLALSMRDFTGSAMATSASLFLQNAHGFTPKSAGWALSGIYVASAISNPLFGHLSDGGRMRWAAVLLLLSACMVMVFPRVSVGGMGPVLVVFGFLFMATYPITEAALMEAVPDAVRGRVFGLFITIGGFLGNLAHWVVGDWVRRLGAGAALPGRYLPLYTTLSGMLLVSLLGLVCLKAIKKRELAAEALTTQKESALSGSAAELAALQ